MSTQVMFKDLPATFPTERKHKVPVALGSVTVHVLLLTAIIVIPLLFPQTMENWRLVTLIGPPPPPPPALAPAQVVSVSGASRAVVPTVEIAPGAVIMPTLIPREIAIIVDDPVEGVLGGVPGGMPGGVAGGILGSVLQAGIGQVGSAPPPPPPPPPPQPPPAPQAAPIVQQAPPAPRRVGGEVKAPRAIKVVPAVYPPLALKARVEGTVIMEALLQADGTVADIKVISGSPFLADAAIDCVKQWQYEPTYLNGTPVPIIMTAIVNFKLSQL